MKVRRWLWTIPLLLVLLIAACGPEPTPPLRRAIDIQDFAFRPDSLTVAKGSIVTWTNEDSVEHTVSTTSAPQGQGWDSGRVKPGQLFRKTFKAVGTYKYRCNIHPAMTATIMVTD